MKDSIPTNENIFIPNEEVQTLEVDQKGKHAKGKSADLPEANPLPVLTDAGGLVDDTPLQDRGALDALAFKNLAQALDELDSVVKESTHLSTNDATAESSEAVLHFYTRVKNLKHENERLRGIIEKLEKQLGINKNLMATLSK